jgi:hypothetical protein
MEKNRKRREEEIEERGVDGQKGRGREREGGQRENIERIHTKRKE